MSIIKHERRQVIQTHAIRSEHSAIRYGLSRQPPVTVNTQTVKKEMLQFERKHVVGKLEWNWNIDDGFWNVNLDKCRVE